jgi:hypothetical protein
MEQEGGSSSVKFAWLQRHELTLVVASFFKYKDDGDTFHM